MKTVCKKLLCLMLVAMLLVSAVPAAFADEAETVDITINLKLNDSNDVVDTKVFTAIKGDLVYPGRLAQMKYWNSYEFKAFWSSATGETYEGITDSFAAEADSTVVVRMHEYNYVPDNSGSGNTDSGNTDSGNTDSGNTDSGNTDSGNEDNNVSSGKLIVTVYNWDGNNRTQIAEEEYPAGTYTLNDSFAAQVYPGQKIKYDWGSRTGNVVTVTDEDVNVALSVTPLKTENGKAVYKLRVMFNRGNGNDDYKQIDIYEGEGILAAIKNAGITPKYEDHVLVGYLNSHTGNANTYLTIYDVASAAMANDQGVIKVSADWREVTDDDDEDFEYGEGGGLYGDDNDDPIYDVVLYIYTNGKTSSYAKKVSSSSMGKHTKDGVLTRDEVQLVVENYFKTNSDTKYYGLFTKYYWNSGNYLTENAKYSIELDPDQTNYVYVMVKNAKAYVADSSNPKTGDTIMIAVTGMTLAAACLVSMIELKKRKMI